MAKIIKYSFLSCRMNKGTDESPLWEDVLIPKEIECTADKLEANESIAKREAYNGEYTIEDDGQPEPDTTSTDDVLNALLGVE